MPDCTPGKSTSYLTLGALLYSENSQEAAQETSQQEGYSWKGHGFGDGEKALLARGPQEAVVLSPGARKRSPEGRDMRSTAGDRCVLSLEEYSLNTLPQFLGSFMKLLSLDSHSSQKCGLKKVCGQEGLRAQPPHRSLEALTWL